jgi:bifunctional DNase/RNase
MSMSMGRRKAVGMVEVTVHDVLFRVPKGAEVQWPQDASKLERMATVVLKEREGERCLSVWVGRPEAIAIAQPLAAVVTPRPLTHDLIARLVEVSASRVEKMAITKLHDRTFYATLWVRVGECVHEVDARPSDALSLALRMQMPIFIAADLFEQQSQPLEQMPAILAQRSQELDPPGDTEIELRSFRSLLYRDVSGPLQSPQGK